MIHGPYNVKLSTLTSSVPVAAQSKAWVCVRSPAKIVGSNPNCFECCVLSGRGLCDKLVVQRSPTDCGASLCVI